MGPYKKVRYSDPNCTVQICIIQRTGKTSHACQMGRVTIPIWISDCHQATVCFYFDEAKVFGPSVLDILIQEDS